MAKQHGETQSGIGWRMRRIAASLGIASMMATGLVAIAAPAPAEAVDASQFDPGYIISDSLFYDSGSMTRTQIQAFLEARGSVLKSHRDTVKSQPRRVSDATGNLRCEAFQGGSNITASTIIYRAQVACGISAKVILVTLQKEQGLINKSAASKSALDRAMGQACPDTAPCAEYALGFGNQVYLGTLQLKTYKASNFGLQPGVHHIKYNPVSSCGTLRVNVRNYATIALYNYTPYTPNKAALNSYPGMGNSCSSYGNRNFWFQYHAWFGSPTAVIPEGVSAKRLSGEGRVETAVKISQENFDATTTTVYVANGLNFPDALSAAPAAALQNAPLLLVEPKTLPSAVAAEIKRLKPEQIVVVGGAGVVSKSVYDKLAALAPSIRRDSGESRYDTGRAIVGNAFSTTGSTIAYIATGENYPDALSASVAAGAQAAPVVLVEGSKKSVDSATRDLLVSLGVTKVVIAGGTGVVSSSMAKALAKVPGVTEVKRVAGEGRLETSRQLNLDAFSSADSVYVASADSFPDALAGAAVAGASKSPLYLVSRTCINTPVVQDFIDFGVDKMVALGGSGVISSSVMRFKNC